MRPSPFRHVLLTRFSYRSVNARKLAGTRSPHGGGWARFSDPLHPRCLEARFRLFETIYLPSVMGQTSQEFDWVVIIDRALPPSYLERLSSLLQGRARTHTVAFDPSWDMRRLAWLRVTGVLPSGGAVLTSLLD